MTRFLIIGLPRSGTTYLSTLLHSHRDVRCEGELFNPFAIVGEGWRKADDADLIARDRDPVAFLEAYFAAHAETPAVGCKWMIGHHVEILDYLAKTPEIRIIYVHRANKLAQSASLIAALQSKRWAAVTPDEVAEVKLEANPMTVAQHMREAEMQDFLFAQWLKGLSNPVLSVEYRGLFSPEFERELCGFLGVAHDPEMKSQLLQQGQSDIIGRFERRRRVSNYFYSIGKGRWFVE